MNFTKALLRFVLFILFVIACIYAVGTWKNPSAEIHAPVSTNLQAISQPSEESVKDRADLLEIIDAQWSGAVQEVLPSVVSIDANPKFIPTRQFFGGQSKGFTTPQAKGSGVIVSGEGHIVTNLHVVRGSDSIQVTFSDGRVAPAILEGSDKATDIAVLKVQNTPVQPLKFGNSDMVRPGQIVFAIGNPFGLQESVSQGIISGLGRRALNESLNEYIQTDSAVNPGNSGGPLVNVRGEVIGINNFIFSQDGGSMGIGFAIPSNTVRKVVEDIVKHGRVIRPYLGITFTPLPAVMGSPTSHSPIKGALIQTVEPHSPAEQAGLQVGDIIQSFRGRPIHDAIDLRNRVLETPVDQNIEIRILRNGKEQTLTANIREAEFSAESFTLPVRPPIERGAFDGIVAAELNPTLAAQWNIPTQLEGALVTDLLEGSPALRLLQPGDVIIEAEGKSIRTRDDLLQAASQSAARVPATIVIVRDRYRFLVRLDPR